MQRLSLWEKAIFKNFFFNFFSSTKIIFAKHQCWQVTNWKKRSRAQPELIFHAKQFSSQGVTLMMSTNLGLHHHFVVRQTVFYSAAPLSICVSRLCCTVVDITTTVGWWCPALLCLAYIILPLLLALMLVLGGKFSFHADAATQCVDLCLRAVCGYNAGERLKRQLSLACSKWGILQHVYKEMILLVLWAWWASLMIVNKTDF